MSKELTKAMNLINKRLKQVTYLETIEKLKSQKLDKLIYSLKGEFVSLVDVVTINYAKTQMYKTKPDEKKYDTSFVPTELTKGERERAIETLQWFQEDIRQCINHLNNNKL